MKKVIAECINCMRWSCCERNEQVHNEVCMDFMLHEQFFEEEQQEQRQILCDIKQQFYKSNHKEVCPYCHGRIETIGGMDFDGYNGNLMVKCNDCGRKFIEMYEYSHLVQI